MVRFTTAAFLLIGTLLTQLTNAIPPPTPIQHPHPPPKCTTAPSTCYSICPTPTITTTPTHCPKIRIVCPLFRCAPPEPITSTYTHFCRGSGTCAGVASTSCDAKGVVPTVTVVGHCQVGCPDPCPLDIRTVAVACPTVPPVLGQT